MVLFPPRLEARHPNPEKGSGWRAFLRLGQWLARVALPRRGVQGNEYHGDADRGHKDPEIQKNFIGHRFSSQAVIGQHR
jgi:hypothetical protein